MVVIISLTLGNVVIFFIVMLTRPQSSRPRPGAALALGFKAKTKAKNFGLDQPAALRPRPEPDISGWSADF